MLFKKKQLPPIPTPPAPAETIDYKGNLTKTQSQNSEFIKPPIEQSQKEAVKQEKEDQKEIPLFSYYNQADYIQIQLLEALYQKLEESNKYLKEIHKEMVSLNEIART